ncbi:hypothetical protein BDZ94DRAFT_1239074 [Collybia nuda]|uniref:Uncharacterized protein n=1 Tax=Collybia nuda TaxID=64659 RepID=A0A9P5XZK2_9AGAR|nr:hypothetical protein BDZ94DRAFT_1239074 [Collybia nuda]
MARTRTFPDRAETGPREKATENGRVAPHKNTDTRIRGRKNMNLQQRIAVFENDEWAENAMEEAVDCVGCGKRIKLDKRTPFNYEPFKKHKRRCVGIISVGRDQKLEGVDDYSTPININYLPKPTLATWDVNLLEKEEPHNIFHDKYIQPVGTKSVSLSRTWSASTYEAAETLLSLSQNV